MTPRERIEAIVQILIDLLDQADGDTDLEAEHHDAEALFPGHPFYGLRLGDKGDAGPSDPEDAEDSDDDYGMDGS